jgi:hypothetical protein
MSKKQPKTTTIGDAEAPAGAPDNSSEPGREPQQVPTRLQLYGHLAGALMTGIRLGHETGALLILGGGLKDEPGTPIAEAVDALIDDIDNCRGREAMIARAKADRAKLDAERGSNAEALFALPDINAPGSKTKH